MTSHDDRQGCEGIATAAWSRRGWPLMTGAVAAVGLTLTWRLYGPFGTPLALAGLWFFFSVVVFGTLSEETGALRRAVRVGGAGSVVVLVLMGLLTRFPDGGWVAVGVCALTSPPVVGRVRLVVHRARRRLEARRPAGPAPGTPVAGPAAVDQASVDQAFEAIVSDLRWPDP